MLELSSYISMLRIIVLGYEDGIDQNKNHRPTQQIGEVFVKCSLRYFVSIIDLHLERRVGNLSD